MFQLKILIKQVSNTEFPVHESSSLLNSVSNASDCWKNRSLVVFFEWISWKSQNGWTQELFVCKEETGKPYQIKKLDKIQASHCYLMLISNFWSRGRNTFPTIFLFYWKISRRNHFMNSMQYCVKNRTEKK